MQTVNFELFTPPNTTCVMKLPYLLFLLFLIHSLWGQGDNPPAGIAVPAGGKWVNPDSVAKPQVAPAGKPVETSFPSNTRPAGRPRIVQLQQEPGTITPGKHGVPLPIMKQAKGKIIPTRHPQPVPVLPLDLKNNAVADFQILSESQGMPSLLIGAMLEDRNGNIWFGTWNGGLNIFDGKSFTYIKKEDGLSNNIIQAAHLRPLLSG